MTPEDLMARLADLAGDTERMARDVREFVTFLPTQVELEHALAVAAGKRGSRRWAR